MVSDSELVERLREVLRSSDLNTTTTAILRRRLEEDFGVDLSDKKLFIREQVDLFLSEMELIVMAREGVVASPNYAAFPQHFKSPVTSASPERSTPKEKPQKRERNEVWSSPLVAVRRWLQRYVRPCEVRSLGWKRGILVPFSAILYSYRQYSDD
ncbi:hypothetical protein E2562_014191 [Oryza meyeriana var. granulata]|uniref:DEK-C domain-containing protein n=1 Tax=Oryza meyeriana var. granulata TaxID=110450 RepID=A0A6G1BK84_9ORYZ|nr:hypothetical protein E2562_014191 [Oryza meyeriana var. granulata]